MRVLHLEYLPQRTPDGQVCCPQLMIFYMEPWVARQFEQDCLEMASPLAAYDALRQGSLWFWWWDDVHDLFHPSPEVVEGVTLNGEPVLREEV